MKLHQVALKEVENDAPSRSIPPNRGRDRLVLRATVTQCCHTVGLLLPAPLIHVLLYQSFLISLSWAASHRGGVEESKPQSFV